MSEDWDERREHERDLEYESRLADEQEHTDDPYEEHMRRMLRFGLDWINDNASGTKSDAN